MALELTRTADDRRAGLLRSLPAPGPATILSAALIVVVLLWLVAPGWFTSADPLTGDSAQVFRPPSAAHPFGTDHLGRDVLARVIHGTTQTALTAGLAVVVGLVLGTLVGIASSTLGPWAEAIGMRVIDALIALPAFMIALFVVSAYGAGPVSLGIGVGIGSVVLFARVTRAEILRVRSLDYLEASLLAGAGYLRQLVGHVLPAITGALVALAVVDFGAAVLAVSALGFLGFGTPPPTPEWGLIIAEGRNYLANAWWMTALPGTFVLVVVVALGVLSRYLGKATRA
ncbi:MULTISPECIES: ABC transporter permease [Rathayibacter]|uniref:ABC transporter permease n=1 Tax=Rathayibacter TaxID=33886 RepID=UPI000B09FC86|nr:MULTISPECIES: ABC transporter permease [Rathayibacter]MCJ1696905.1 ABC transporter permease [Rathayibacter caricis]